MIETDHRPHIACILRSYPRLSQTFILHEIRALEQLGLRLHVFAITDPQEPIVQAQVAEVRAPVQYLSGERGPGRAAVLWAHLWLLATTPRRYLRCLRYVLRRPDLDEGYTAGSRYQCFNMAVYLACALRLKRAREQPITHLHAHFAHAPTLIALLTHMLTDIPYSFTAHARDLYQLPVAALTDRMREARAVVTCCAANVAYLERTVSEALHPKVQLIRHGVDLRAFQPGIRDDRHADPPLILSVGRLVEKKGFPDLLHACRHLKQRGYRFRCAIYGDGPLRAELERMIEQLGLTDEVALAGACTQDQLVRIYQRASVFALTPFVTDDGDRDGVPNVLIEAMACGLPVVSTSVGGIPELVLHDQTGLVAEPHEIESIAALLAVLLDDRERCARLGSAARRFVTDQFDLAVSARRLAALFSPPLHEHLRHAFEPARGDV